MPRPLLLAVDADPETLSRIEAHLQRRFGGDFRSAASSPPRPPSPSSRPPGSRATRS